MAGKPGMARRANRDPEYLKRRAKKIAELNKGKKHRKDMPDFHVEAFNRWCEGLSDMKNGKAEGVCFSTIIKWRRKEKWEEIAGKVKDKMIAEMQQNLSERARKAGETAFASFERALIIGRHALLKFFAKDGSIAVKSEEVTRLTLIEVREAVDLITSAISQTRLLGGMHQTCAKTETGMSFEDFTAQQRQERGLDRSV